MRQKPDHRDWLYVAPRRLLKALPASADVSANLPLPMNQADLGACGPFTAKECICYDQQIEKLAVVGASPLFTYWNTRYLMGTVGQDSGVDNRTMLKALGKWGFCPDSLWPYHTSAFQTKPDQAAYDAAVTNKITSYAVVPKSLDQMKACIVSGFPFLFGFDVFPQMESAQAETTGILTMPAGNSIGGHDVSVCGFNATGGNLPGVLPGNVWPNNTFKFLNHWLGSSGKPWGDAGFGYIPFAYSVGSHADDFWVINAVPGGPPSPPVPPPVPPPEPIPSPPVPVPSTKLFSFALPRAVKAGGVITMRPPVNMPRATYDVLSHLTSFVDVEIAD